MFTFEKNNIEYTFSFIYFEKEDKFLFGYSKKDSNNSYYFVSKKTIEGMMNYF